MKRVILLLVSILLISLGYAFAEVPCKINYQGRLIKDNVPVHNTAGIPMMFKLFNTATGTEGEKVVYSGNVPVYNGLFRVVLDLEGVNWTAGEAKYLQVIVDEEPLSPREELSAYPYAINSHLLEGATKEYFLNTSEDTQTKRGNLNIMGNVGIGTPSPVRKLDIDGGVYLRSDAQTQRTYFPPQAGQDADGLYFRSDSSFANQAANAGIFLKRLAFNDAPGSANDITEKVGLWLGGFHDNSGTGVPLYLGGFLYNQDIPAMVIQSGGNVGIGTTSPGEKLTVAGTIESTTGGVKFPDGTLQATAVSPIQKYDSGWFLVTTGGSYTKTHNLGSQLLITQILFAPNSGGSPDLNHVTCIVGHNDANVDWRYVNLVTGFIYDIMPTTLKINTGREAVAVIPHDTYWVTKYTSGWYRVLALRID